MGSSARHHNGCSRRYGGEFFSRSHETVTNILIRQTQISYRLHARGYTGLYYWTGIESPYLSAFLETISACPPSTISATKASTSSQLRAHASHYLKDYGQKRIARVAYNRRFFLAKQTTPEGEE
jgi:hypothetical protein